MKHSFIVLITAIALTSCTKHAGDVPEETPKATLVITLPSVNQVLKTTDSIRISGTAIASAIIHGYDVYLTKQGDTARLQSASVHDHNDTLVVDTKFAPMISGRYEAHILLKLDHDGNTLHKYVALRTE